MRTRFDAKNYMRISKKLWNFKRVRVGLATSIKPARKRSNVPPTVKMAAPLKISCRRLHPSNRGSPGRELEMTAS
jgi:hypothetical protein